MKKKKPVKAEKYVNDKSYVMKKTRKMHILRTVCWVMLSFVFIRGVISCLHPDKASEINRLIDEFKTEYYATQDTDYEVLGFAENFCMEYLTYDKDKELFMKRMESYFSPKINIEEIYDFNNTCEAVSAQAYKIDKTSKCQVDVYVRCKLSNNYQNTKSKKNIVLKVPVYIGKEGYVVEDIPMYVNDFMYDKAYSPEVQFVGGKSVDADIYESIVKSFFSAYYNVDQTAVNYILSPHADVSKFYCLGKLYSFTKLEDLQAYKLANGEVLCLVSYKITDTTSGAVILQDVNITITGDGKRLYVKDMNTKIANLEEKDD